MADSNSIFLIVIVIAMVGLMFWQSRSAKKQRSKQEDFRTGLKPGDKVATLSGLIGNIVEVDLDHDQVVLDSEGSRSRWRIQAITEAPVEPHYISDEEYEQSQQEAAAQDAVEDDAPSTEAVEADTQSTEAEEDKASAAK